MLQLTSAKNTGSAGNSNQIQNKPEGVMGGAAHSALPSAGFSVNFNATKH